MARKFKSSTSRPLSDRRALLDRASRSSSSRTTTPSRGGSPLQSRVSALRGGGSPGQGAIDFGKAMTGGGGVQNAVDAIRSRVANQLAGKGIYQDQGGYHIQGLSQPPDIGIAMRDAAVHAMGGDPWTKIVQEADARLRSGNLPLPRTAGVNGPPPQPGLGGTPGSVVPSVGGTPTGRLPNQSGGAVPQPGLGGVPSIPSVARPTGGSPQPGLGGTVPTPIRSGVPQPGLGGVPPVTRNAPVVTNGNLAPGQGPLTPGGSPPPFPPQGQGVGRTATPTGNQISPGQYPTTAPSPGLGGVPSSPGLQSRQLSNGASIIREPSGGAVFTFPDGSQGIIPSGGAPPRSIPSPAQTGRVGVSQPPSTTPTLGSSINANDRMGISAPTQQSIDNGAFNPYQQPLSPSGTGGNRGLDPNSSQQQRIGMGTGGQVIGSAIGTNLQNSANVTPPGRVNPQSGVPSPGLGGVPQLSGRPATPTVAPGALPGNSTPSRPGQMPSVFPNGKVFGSPGSPQMPAMPQMPGMPAMPGMKDLSGLGDQISQTVAGRIDGIRNQTQMPTTNPAQTAMSGLEGLGDRIRASVMRGQSGMPTAPGAAVPGLGEGLGATIVDRVRQLTQGIGRQGMPVPGMPSAAPSTGGMPVPPGGAPTTAAPVPGTTAPSAAPAPAPAGSIGAPQGTIQASLGFGVGGDWNSVNQYDASFVSAGQKYGVDPAMLKAMAVIESGGQMIPNQNGSGAYGVMQIKESDWGWLANQIGADLSTADGQIQTAAAILGQYGTGSTPEERFLNSYYPTPCMTCPGEDGSTPQQYLDSMHDLMGQINAANTGAPTTTGVGPPTTGTQVLPTNAPQQIDPATGAPIGATPVTGANGGVAPVSQVPVDQATGEVVTSAGGAAPTDARPPQSTGTISPMTTPNGEMTGLSQGASMQQGDGLGIYAGPNADESWVNVLSPNGGVNGDYKENVCGERYGEYGCCNGGECSYASTSAYLDPNSANQTVHPGYDIALENGTTFNSPIGGVVLGTKSNSGGAGCVSPDKIGLNECSWAYDNGMVIGGITDGEGQEIYVNLDHTSPDESLVGQTVQPGQPLGVGLDKGHVHVESHGYCPDSGMMVVLDPSLVMGGYYNTHSVCEGVTRPVSS